MSPKKIRVIAMVCVLGALGVTFTWIYWPEPALKPEDVAPPPEDDPTQPGKPAKPADGAPPHDPANDPPNVPPGSSYG